MASLLLFSSLAFAIPNSLTLQGKLTNLAGSSQVGAFNFTFRIYDAAAAGNELWSSGNISTATDANGIYDVILNGLNLTFADQYYLGIAVQGENESTPRINLTSAPYSFRANTSEALNPNASYFVRNISISGHATIGNGSSTIEISTQRFNVTTSGNLIQAGNITLGDQIIFRLGEIIDNLVDGWLKITGGLNVTSSLFVTANATVTGDFTVNNTFNVTASSGNVNVGGILDTGNLRVAGRVVQIAADAFNIGNLSSALLDRNFSANFSNISVVSLPLGWTNLTNYPGACPAGQFLTQIGDTLTCSAAATGPWNSSGANTYLNDTTASVGIGTAAPGQKLHIVGSANVSAAVNAPVINTTLATQNITISSAAGSVIIRLG